VGYALAGWTQRKQALHDLIADTCVVFDTVKPGEELPSVRPPMPWYGWLANIVLLAIFPVSILAAIALPAYNDYLTRAKIVAAAVEADAAKMDIAESMMSDSTCPQRSVPTTHPMIESLQLGGRAPDCLITLTFAGGAEVPDAVRNQSIEWVRRSDTEWVCSSLIQDRYLPAICRN
jgi:Tfp pilus assembly major pilin PilA